MTPAHGAALVALVGLLAVSCAEPRAPAVDAVQAPASSASIAPRMPDAVVLEPGAAIPSASVEAPARGVVALHPALSIDAMRDCVERLLDAWQRGSLDGLTSLLASDAGPLEARARGPGALVEAFRQRLRARDYKKLEGLELTRLDRIEHYAWSELSVPDAPARPADMRPDEILVRVPLEVTQIAGEKYFEPTIVLLVRAEQQRAKITAYGEGP